MTFLNCKIKSCTNKAIFFKDYCLEHTEDKESLIKEIHDFVNSKSTIKGFNFTKVPFDGFDFSSKNISYSIFSHCSMKKAKFVKTTMISTFFDFTELQESDFSNSFSRFSVFGGANLSNTNFYEAIMFSSNFLGAKIENTIFKNTDLSYSRFIGSIINNTSFNNCNLKKAFFQNSILDDISLKTSNYQDAILLKCDNNKTDIILEDYKP